MAPCWQTSVALESNVARSGSYAVCEFGSGPFHANDLTKMVAVALVR